LHGINLAMRTSCALRPPAVLLLALSVLAGGPRVAAGAGPAVPEDQAAPSSGRAAAPGFAEAISVAWVLVPVVVRSRSGYVEGLSRDAFRLWVDGRQVAVESFDSGAQAPVSLVFLQDLSGSMATAGKVELARTALGDLLAAARPADELALASFAGGRLAVDVPFTGDREPLFEAMAGWDPYGTTALHDAVAWVPDISVEGRHPKRAVVLVTDGVDNASVIPPETAREILQRAHLPVYVLGLDDRGDPLRPAADGGADTYAQLLGRLAWATGGRYFDIAGTDDVRAAVATILQDLRSEYVLGFSADGAEARFRRLRVEVDGRGRETVFRVGYTGGQPAAWKGPGRG
jgi:Ca-activated chloride channel family protein